MLFLVYGVLKLLEFYVFFVSQCHFKIESVTFILFVVSLLFQIWDCIPIKQSVVEWNHFAEVVANVANFTKPRVLGERLWQQDAEMVHLGWHLATE